MGRPFGANTQRDTEEREKRACGAGAQTASCTLRSQRLSGVDLSTFSKYTFERPERHASIATAATPTAYSDVACSEPVACCLAASDLASSAAQPCAAVCGCVWWHMISTAQSSVHSARHRAGESTLPSSRRESIAVATILPCCISVKAEAEMRRSATNESKFIARKISAGTAMGSELVASHRAAANGFSSGEPPASALRCL